MGGGRPQGRQGSAIPYIDPPGEPKLRAMYVCQTLSGFADRMWEFSIPFFLLALNRPDSMALAIFYAVVAGLTNVAGGPVVGYAVDKFPRLQTVTVCLTLQTFLVLVSYIAMRTALSLSASSGGIIAALVVILTISSSAASLASLASTHAIERDWIKCLNRYEEEGIRRSERILRGIGIASRVLAPISVGLLLALCNVQTAAAGIAAWTLVTIPIEWSILRILYLTNPRLTSPRPGMATFVSGDNDGSEKLVRSGSGTLLTSTQTVRRERGSTGWLMAYRASWRDYLDVDGDGVLRQSEIFFAVRSGVMRCWDLWFGCVVGMSFFVYIKRLLAMSFI